MRQPDIEIYLKEADRDAVGHWLETVFGATTPWRTQGKTFKCEAGDIAVSWFENAVGKWHCLLLESDATPWADDLQCAHAAHRALGVQVRCAPGGWNETQGEEDADRWISVDEHGEKEILWRTG